MLFVTAKFLFFFVIVYLIFWSLPARFRLTFLLISSLIFYASWSLIFTLHFIVVIGINYYTIEFLKKNRKDWIFILLQIANLSNLGFFKYFYFFADIAGRLFGQDWLRQPDLQHLQRIEGNEILLPLAISFYTFQIMAYGIDVYKGVYTGSHSFREVLLFKAFFPQLIAGPIMRSSELLPQIADCKAGIYPVADARQMKKGLWLILIGVFKKILIAGQLLVFLAPMIASPGATPLDFTPQSVFLGVTGSMAMLYADFSAYTDLARGLGLLLGFKIPENFKAPFLSHSISEFWRRWHLTFSLWIRDYIFIPLGGSRRTEARVYLNVVITFFLGGLWHGASYTFVFWGFFMGVAIAIESYLDKRGFHEMPAFWPARIIRIIIVWIIFIFITTFFFAPDASWAVNAIRRMMSFHLIGDENLKNLGSLEIYFASIAGVMLFQWFELKPSHFTWIRKYENWVLPVAAIGFVLVLTQFAGPQKDFFYFQF